MPSTATQMDNKALTMEVLATKERRSSAQVETRQTAQALRESVVTEAAPASPKAGTPLATAR